MSKRNQFRFYAMIVVAILLLISSGYLLFELKDAKDELRMKGTYIEQLEDDNDSLKAEVNENASIIAHRGTQIDKKEKRIDALTNKLKASQNRIQRIEQENAERIAAIDSSTQGERREMLLSYSERLDPITLKYERDTVFAFKEGGQKEMLRLFQEGRSAKRTVGAMTIQDTIQKEIISTQDSIIGQQDSTITDYERSVMLYEQIVENYDEQKGEYEHKIDLHEDKISSLKWQNRALWGGIAVGGAVIVKMLLSD